MSSVMRYTLARDAQGVQFFRRALGGAPGLIETHRHVRHVAAPGRGLHEGPDGVVRVVKGRARQVVHGGVHDAVARVPQLAIHLDREVNERFDLYVTDVARFQVVEYMRAFLLFRLACASQNAVVIVSGAFGLFRRDAVIAADTQGCITRMNAVAERLTGHGTTVALVARRLLGGSN